MKYVSLFSGIGGFDLALDRLDHECVYANDFDKYAAIIYNKNFTHTLDTTSIVNVPASSIPNHDLLVGGFPCQAFSIAGKRKGFQETRGTLFFDIARILKYHQTKYFLLENVKGLLSHDSGRTFRVIIKTLTELGYDLQWQVCNSKNFGVPQNRERVFVVGNLREQPRPQVFPFTENSKPDIVLPTLTARYWGGQANEGYIGYKEVKVGTYRTHKDGRGFREIKSGVAPTIPARAREDGSGQGVVLQNKRIRRLTPIECERLQGFPDNHTEGISDTQRYKCLGNAVTVNVVYEIAKRAFNSL